jgi:hypothetical protein
VKDKFVSLVKYSTELMPGGIFGTSGASQTKFETMSHKTPTSLRDPQPKSLAGLEGTAAIKDAPMSPSQLSVPSVIFFSLK